MYSHPINNLPYSLKYLKIGKYFSHSLNGILPDGLCELIFDSDSNYSHPIDMFPNFLITLKLGKFYTHPILKFPENLVNLIFAENNTFSHPIHSLPNTLKRLELGNKFSHPLGFYNLPNGLEYLKLGTTYNHPFIVSETNGLCLPPNLKSLIFDKYSIYSHPLDFYQMD